jgi:predicted CoA-binding protein
VKPNVSREEVLGKATNMHNTLMAIQEPQDVVLVSRKEHSLANGDVNVE